MLRLRRFGCARVNLDKPGGCRAARRTLGAYPRRGLPFTWCWFYMDAQHTNDVEHSGRTLAAISRLARTTTESAALPANRAAVRERPSGRTAGRGHTAPGRRL